MSLEWHGDRIVAAVNGAAEDALADGGEHLLEASNRIAPIETGALIRSGTVVAQGKEAAVGYSSVYAARQHEEVGWSHDNGRQAKYLETALASEAGAIERAIAARLTRELE